MLFHQIITSEHLPQKNKTNQRNLLGSGFCVYVFRLDFPCVVYCLKMPSMVEVSGNEIESFLVDMFIW